MRKELIILSGFLGSGKTTLLRSLLLRHSDRKIAVLLNDFGDIPVDGETLRRSGVEGGVVVEIGGGSVFCSCLREPFIKALANLAARDEDLDHRGGLRHVRSLRRGQDAPALRPRRPF